MADLVKLLWAFIGDCFRSHAQLKAENAILRHQLNVLRRRTPRRWRLSGGDRALFVWLYRLCPRIADAITIIRPETVVGWHRAGFRAWWRWKSCNLGGRPKIDRDLRDLVRRMTCAPWPGSECGMGDKIKRAADNAAIDHRFEDWTPNVWNPPRCHCGVPATFGVNLHTRVDFYCTKHLPADALEPHGRER